VICSVSRIGKSLAGLRTRKSRVGALCVAGEVRESGAGPCATKNLYYARNVPVDKQTLIPVLQQLRFTEALPEHVLEQLASASVLRGYAAETVLFREGAQNHELMVICVGGVALDMLVPGRGEVRIMSLGPGDVVAWSALLGGGRMTTSAVALEDTQVVSISAGALLAICETDQVFGYHLMRRVASALADRLIATRLQLLDLFADSAPLIPQGPD
jgi:CRP/FNR family transcriptional regulator, cyclic AMP receptor protein